METFPHDDVRPPIIEMILQDEDPTSIIRIYEVVDRDGFWVIEHIEESRGSPEVKQQMIIRP